MAVLHQNAAKMGGIHRADGSLTEYPLDLNLPQSTYNPALLDSIGSHQSQGPLLGTCDTDRPLQTNAAASIAEFKSRESVTKPATLGVSSDNTTPVHSRERQPNSTHQPGSSDYRLWDATAESGDEFEVSAVDSDTMDLPDHMAIVPTKARLVYSPESILSEKQKFFIGPSSTLGFMKYVQELVRPKEASTVPVRFQTYDTYHHFCKSLDHL